MWWITAWNSCAGNPSNDLAVSRMNNLDRNRTSYVGGISENTTKAPCLQSQQWLSTPEKRTADTTDGRHGLVSIGMAAGNGRRLSSASVVSHNIVSNKHSTERKTKGYNVSELATSPVGVSPGHTARRFQKPDFVTHPGITNLSEFNGTRGGH